MYHLCKTTWGEHTSSREPRRTGYSPPNLLQGFCHNLQSPHFLGAFPDMNATRGKTSFAEEPVFPLPYAISCSVSSTQSTLKIVTEFAGRLQNTNLQNAEYIYSLCTEAKVSHTEYAITELELSSNSDTREPPFWTAWFLGQSHAERGWQHCSLLVMLSASR